MKGGVRGLEEVYKNGGVRGRLEEIYECYGGRRKFEGGILVGRVGSSREYEGMGGEPG